MDQVLIYWKELYLICGLLLTTLDFYSTLYAEDRFNQALLSEAELTDIIGLSVFPLSMYDLPLWKIVAVFGFILLLLVIVWPYAAVKMGIQFMGKGDWE
jgi:hypothetical protein